MMETDRSIHLLNEELSNSFFFSTDFDVDCDDYLTLQAVRRGDAILID